MKKTALFLTLMLSGQINLFAHENYEPDWESLKNYEAPEWYEDAKLGFWAIWGPYSVPAFRGDHSAEWYGRWMYLEDLQSRWNMGLATREHHEEKYGNPSEFGYKDFIPMFTGDKFDADEWADFCVEGGAKYFCTLAVFHDAFCMWDTDLTEWNSVDMGPKRDVVAEVSEAVKKKGLKFGVSNHSAWNFQFFQWNHVNKYDAVDPVYQNLYGNPIIDPAIENVKYDEKTGLEGWFKAVKGLVMPSERDLNRWLDRTKELCDLYQPDLYYFDWGMNGPAFETRRREFGAHYYNKALEWNKGEFGDPGVVLNYKNEAFAKGSAVHDHERGKKSDIAPMVWQTDDSVYDGHTWGYADGIPIKKPNTVIDKFVDIVSKRGVLMLAFAPKADGSFPDDQRALAREIGSWLSVCGEAIYSTRPWIKFGEGNDDESKLNPNSANIRFTRNKAKTVLYAILLDWKDGEVIIESVDNEVMPKDMIKNVSLIGSSQKLNWKMGKSGLTVQMPKEKPDYEYAYPIKIELNQAMEIAD